MSLLFKGYFKYTNINNIYMALTVCTIDYTLLVFNGVHLLIISFRYISLHLQLCCYFITTNIFFNTRCYIRYNLVSFLMSDAHLKKFTVSICSAKCRSSSFNLASLSRNTATSQGCLPPTFDVSSYDICVIIR